MALMKLLIIGGTGVLSSAVVNEALKQNIEVSIVNRGKKKNIIPDGVKLIKADYTILSQYKYNQKHISVSSTIIYNEDDPTCVNMEDWKKICCGHLDYLNIGNGHFFINDHCERNNCCYP